jgi:hypothetical protein
MYTFELTEFSGEQALTTAWTDAPGPEQLWIALSRWDLDAWQWFAAEPDSGLAIPDIALYLDETDRLLAVVLTTDSPDLDVFNLDLLYFAESPPVIDGVIPTSGTAGTEVSFMVNAQGVLPFTYSWDFAGGATPNVSSEDSPTVTLGTAGTYNASVTLSNAFDSDTFLFDLDIEDSFVPGTGQIVAQAATGTTTVGQPVMVTVSCGDFPHPFKFMNGVAVTVEVGAEYEPLSFNIGAPGGTQKAADGLWAAVNPTTFLIPEDNQYSETPVDGEPDLIYSSFNAVPIGGDDVFSGGELFNFEMNFTAAGTYTLGFLEFQTVKRTYYSDSMSNEYYWNNIANGHDANTIVVSE